VDFSENFARTRLAGLPARAVFSAVDAAGQASEIVISDLLLPSRFFSDPLAAGYAELSRDLAWSPGNADRAINIAHALTIRPENWFRNLRAFLIAQAAVNRMAMPDGVSMSPEQRGEAVALLWGTALTQEEGQLSLARERMRQTAENLAEALRRGASPEELARLLEEYRQALESFLRELAASGVETSEQMSANSAEARTLDQNQISAMLRNLEDLMNSGRISPAERLLAEMRRMFESMLAGAALPEGAGEGQSRQDLERLQEALQMQQDLADDTFQSLQ